jgi:putative tricarboxylic transport membrane protein
MRARQVGAAGVLLATGVAGVVEASKLAVGTLGRPGPGFFPFALALGLVVVAAGLVVEAARRPATGTGDRLVHGRAAATLALSAAYVFALEPVGFGVATALYLLALFRLIEPRPWLVSVLLAASTTVGALVVFKVVLAVRLPAGPWGF